nr:6-hydroxymethylpterin diphosphokinase MptE-like protein [Bacillus sp. FJAT-29790]
MYEPNHEIFTLYLHEKNITQLPIHRLKNIFIETSDEAGKGFLESITHNIQERILLVVLPSYRKIFEEQFLRFSENFKVAVGSKRQSYYIDNLFSARWTLNSVLNFSKTIQSPNILSDEYKQHFKDKPLIIVSAGPSLEEEYENLRYIKTNKLAYIFAVGSANKALIAQNIMPDAVCTYDPQGHNHKVFSSIIEQGITNIPMIYGTSVGYETLDIYRGPKLHMITSQDTIAQYYLKNSDDSSIDYVDDSPTIAAVTFQLAAKLGCNPIVFAGQNLAFKNNQFYSKDVEYRNTGRTIFLKESEKSEVLTVEDVYGDRVQTNSSFNNMREFIEFQIKQYDKIEVINTTKGGAAIAGTKFVTLEQLIKERFSSPIVFENWYSSTQNKYDRSYILERLKRMERSIDSFRKLYKEIFPIFEEMDKNISLEKEMKLSKNIHKFDKLMKKLIINESYICYIQPINRSQFQALTIRAANIRKQTNEIDKAKYILGSFSEYLQGCKQTLDQIAACIYKVHFEVERTINDKVLKFYQSNCGGFHYVGNWKRLNYTAGNYVGYSIMNQNNENQSPCISFRFTGTKLRIIGRPLNSLNGIQVLIDEKAEKLTNKSSIDSKGESVIFEKHGLSDSEHLVVIRIVGDSSFLFFGVELENGGRLFHVCEVTSIEQLEIGKRIRCHYEAKLNAVGEFNNLGKGTKGYLNPVLEPYPNGDFYFIMVDEINGVKKLIADRNIQNYISFSNILKSLNKNLKINDLAGSDTRIRLLEVNEAQDLDEWLLYLHDSNLNNVVNPNDEKVWHHERIVKGDQGLHSFIQYTNGAAGAYSKYTNEKMQIKSVNKIINVSSEEVHRLWGFRPVLLIQ